MQRAMRGAGASILVMALLGAVPAMAQANDGEETAQESVGFDEILVTAQRREERLQDIPVAISAFGSEQLERQGITDISTVAPRVPSFYFGSFGATRPQLYIRGIGTRSFDPGSESSVGVFVDDVYLGRASGSFASLRDVERIEVLRGPQGTLYGRNTIGGAINVITKSPTSSFEGQVEAGVSNYKGYNVFGAVGGPLTSSGTVQFRVAGWRDYREGYLTNLTTGTTFQGIDNTGGRAKLAFEPSNAVRIELTAEYTTDGDEAAFAGFNRGSGPIVNPVTGVRTPANPAAIFLGAPGRTPIVNPGGNSGYVSVDPRLDREAQTYIARGEFDLGFASLTSITGYRKLATDEARDLEGSSRSVLDQLGRERSKQFTQEFRLASNPDGALSFGGAVDWVIGGFYYHDKSLRIDTFQLGIDSAVRAAAGTPATDVTIADFKSDSYAAFGQATVHLGEKFDVTVGARYTRDEKRAVQSGTTTDAAPLIAAPFSVSNSAVYTSFDPRLVLTYKVSSDVNVYASYSTGFKSGGFQYVPFAAAQANVLFAPEEITTYEIGFKSEFMDRRVRFNLAAFHYDYTDLQVSRIVDLGGGAAASLIDNAATSKVKGIDAELVLRPSDNFDFSVAYGYLDAKYDTYTTNAPGTTPTPAQIYSGTRLVRAPKHTLNLGAEWRLPLGADSQLMLRADYAMLSDFFHEPGEANPIYGGASSLAGEDGYGLLDLRASVDFGAFKVTGFVTNVLNTDYRRTVFALGSTASDYPGQPRIFGAKVGYSF